MNQLEGRLNDNDKHIQKVEKNVKTETTTKNQKEKETRDMFDRLQESIALQQQSMLQFIDKADKEIKKVDSKASKAGQNAKPVEVDIDSIAEAVQKKQSEQQEMEMTKQTCFQQKD